MKFLLVAALTLTTASTAADPEMILVPKASAEALVQENLKQQATLDAYESLFQSQAKRIHQLQNRGNCS
jgi:Skp family chaperone for outer membrane proteins